MTPLDRDRLLFERLTVSAGDISWARVWAGMILKKKWHHKPWERRGSVYVHQAAFTTSLVVAYGRAFTRSAGWPDLPRRFLTVYDTDDKALHQRLLDLRHTLYAHSDSAAHNIRAWFGADDFDVTIEGSAFMMFTVEETTRFSEMTLRLNKAIRARIEELRAVLKEAHLAGLYE